MATAWDKHQELCYSSPFNDLAAAYDAWFEEEGNLIFAMGLSLRNSSLMHHVKKVFKTR